MYRIKNDSARKKMTTSNNPSGRPRSSLTTDLLHAAFWRLLETTAYDSITMERIAAEAAVSRATLYRRYKSVGELTLAALLVAGQEQLSMRHSPKLANDLQNYFTSLVGSLGRSRLVGRALRILLAKAQTDEALAASFSNFLTRRREPVRLRLASAYAHMPPGQMELTLDQLFGPILYRLLIRNLNVDAAAIRSCIASALSNLPVPD